MAGDEVLYCGRYKVERGRKRKEGILDSILFINYVRHPTVFVNCFLICGFDSVAPISVDGKSKDCGFGKKGLLYMIKISDGR